MLLAPVAGGLVIGLLARFGSEKIRGHGMPEAIEAIVLGGSKIQPRVAALKPVSAAVAIGTGGPFGAEGPIIMTGGAVGSLFAQFLRLTADERKTLLVAGAAGGMAATFNSPFAALTLAVELLFEWRPRSYVPVATAVCVAAVVRRPLLGSAALFPATGVVHLTVAAYALCVVSDIASGLLALAATALVYAAEDAFRRLPVHWMWWPASAGVTIGVGGLLVPQALGVGYNIIDAELTGSIGLGVIGGILIVKTLIWSLSLGSGTSGGVLAPMFMIGGALGTLEAQILPTVGPGFWALTGLAGVLGGMMRSPFTGVIFALEVTHRFDALLPLVNRCLCGVRDVSACSQALRAHREDRPSRISPVPRIQRRPARDPVHRRGDVDRRAHVRIGPERCRGARLHLRHQSGHRGRPQADAVSDRRRGWSAAGRRDAYSAGDCDSRRARRRPPCSSWALSGPWRRARTRRFGLSRVTWPPAGSTACPSSTGTTRLGSSA